ncbi:hypothetical protein [Cyclobacterium marinum]|jgi:NADH:ubiquinone oxidoreductase subunit 6 (subunit J)|uniref:Uncharacterized protein n=1 Tax=Cyclobacterium marinum (strain ATCC 25205 / DSM 745 / LMG 13164 / NCIMB 1802) TaxID=880070 RepID=G0IV73_CYCMS|nr:hypothetical protein [Cyclobacterium marinum]AEL27064.1 hypothetical protein Cycma_3341 [Cyclobacterium marinum DSM 745]MBI0400307.1 hypothetical protein [Cyclobacterium marinum]MBR9776961.1 hypothetical protein [Cytophagales bacterium]|tara:strand:- start:1129 stop:1458 length:330 start_codon:yes stop_codon:yes gene_type:complete
MDTTDIFLYAGYLLVVIGSILALIMPLISSLGDPKSLLKTLVGVVIIAAVFGIAYSSASGDVAAKYMADPFNITPEGAKMVGGVLITVYALFLLAIVGIVITEINKIIK